MRKTISRTRNHTEYINAEIVDNTLHFNAREILLALKRFQKLQKLNSCNFAY